MMYIITNFSKLMANKKLLKLKGNDYHVKNQRK